MHRYILITVFSLCHILLGADDFQYIHREGDMYRILSTVYQDVYYNNRLHHRAETLNRIAVEITGISGTNAMHQAVFQTSERGLTVDTIGQISGMSSNYQWSREYESEFERDHLGRMNIDSRFFMPVVRDVPVFPGRSIEPGEQWSYDGHEMHDFRSSFGIPEPYRIPFTANYEYLGIRSWKDNDYPAFSVSYSINWEPPAVHGSVWPGKILGQSNQIVYWDITLGQAVAYHEEFRYIFELSDGRRIEYRGIADAEIIESSRMNREEIAEEITREIQRLGIEDVSVRTVDEGITISLDNIHFRPDTAIMLPGETDKLDRIAEILLRYQERDILVGGHTALAGTEEGRMRLSQERAGVVADYLISRNTRSPERVVVRGYGAERPIADNSTEEGRQRNRRVEITLLEN
ncbi:MAG: OmpA family protein [Treponema sp.]|nr:OmpA family protein [Treponema sp.]